MRLVPFEKGAVPTILQKLPFYEDQRNLRVPGGPVVIIKHHQIVIWVSITQAGLREFPVDNPGQPRELRQSS